MTTTKSHYQGAAGRISTILMFTFGIMKTTECSFTLPRYRILREALPGPVGW